jgi:hypothetical protein
MVGLRRAIALLILGFYVTQFAMTAWLGPDELFACYLGMSLCYGLAFIGLAAQWFWARWFAMGVGNFGALLLLVLFKIGPEPIIAFVGISHLVISLCLTGEGMAAHYEHSEETAEKWNFQEESLALMRRAVKSAGSTLPFLILYALAPRGEMLNYLLLGTGLLGLFGLLRNRTWSLFVLGGTGIVALLDGFGMFGDPTVGYLMLGTDGTPMIYGQFVGILAGGLLAIPLMYSGHIVRYLRRAAT